MNHHTLVIKKSILFWFDGLNGTCRVLIYERFLHFISSLGAFSPNGNLHYGLHLGWIKINYYKRSCSSPWLISALWLMSCLWSAHISKRPKTCRTLWHLVRSNWRGWKECFNSQVSISFPFIFRLFKQLLPTLKKTSLCLYCVATKQESPLKTSPLNVSLTFSSFLCPMSVHFTSLRCYTTGWWAVIEIFWQAESPVKVASVTASTERDCPKEAGFPGGR